MKTEIVRCAKCGHVFDVDLSDAQAAIKEDPVAFTLRCMKLREERPWTGMENEQPDARHFDCPHRRKAVEEALAARR